MHHPQRILIVGAGIAGLAVARCLQQRRIPFTIVERKPGPDQLGAGILLTSNALTALDAMGTGEAVRAQGRTASTIAFTDHRDEPLFNVSVAAMPWRAPFVSIHRATLQRLLLSAIAPRHVQWGTVVTSLAHRAGHTSVTLSDGTEAAYRVVIGADGVHSQLRSLLVLTEAIAPLPEYVGWRFVAPCPSSVRAPKYMLGNGRTLLLHPLPDEQVYCGAGPVASELVDTGRTPAEQLLAAFGEFSGPASDVLRYAATATLIDSRYYHVTLPRWHVDHSVLIGDAAHACTPTLAQGGAMALEDALVLADRLAATEDVPAALREYEARRRPRVAFAQDASLQRMLANRPASARGLVLRNALLRRVGASQLLGAWSPLMEGSP